MTLATQVVIVQHAREQSKPTATAKLLVAMIEGCEILRFGVLNQPFEVERLAAYLPGAFVLFPNDDSIELSVRSAPAPVEGRRTLVLLDGTWTQASRMSRRVPLVPQLPFYHLPSGEPSIWGMRQAPSPESVCTFEAAARALAILEGAPAVAPLDQAFVRITDRLHDMKEGRSMPPDRCGGSLGASGN